MPTHGADSATYPLGLKRTSNRLRPYTSRWPELFEIEASAIRAVLGTLALDVEHVGSTAIPGMMAKPILDIAVAVERLAVVPSLIEPMATIGYEHAHWAGLKDNEVFGKGKDRTHLVHVVEFGGTHWNDYLRFRNRLRIDASLARKYENLKIEMSHRHATSRADYTAAKHAFIQAILAAA